MQSPDLNQTYFELFGLEPAFTLDRDQLLAVQQGLQSSYHPDRHVNENDRDRRLSVQVASWINQAFETLQDPVKRSRYLLEISGADIPDDSTTTADTEFLMEQIELREDDEVFETKGVKVIVDKKSLMFLDGTEVDFAKSGLNEGFEFKNPNAKDACGCGESFTV